MATAVGADWDVVLPGKRLFASKSRLSAEVAGSGPVLARAMLGDTLRALRDSPSVQRTVVVTSDPFLAQKAQELEAVVVPDPGTALHEIFLAGLLHTRREALGTVLMVADLPCLTPAVVDDLLSLAAGASRAAVPDRDKRGTTALIATRTARHNPQFAAGSFERHLQAGAAPVGLGLLAARQDVDTWADLRRARHLGLGPLTAAAAQEVGGSQWADGDEEMVQPLVLPDLGRRA